MGAIVFELVGGAIFPLASTDQPVSTTWPSRLFARLLVTVTTVAVVMLVMSGPFSANAERSREVAPPAPS